MTDRGSELIEGFQSVTAALAAVGRTAETEADHPIASRIPVTVLTGFLGSGKTTVLRHLLAGDHGLAVTAVVNDLGAINIDARQLDDGPAADKRIELANGCACCLLGDELHRSLIEAAGTDPPPDAIVIEASGAADAIAMTTTIEAAPELGLDGIVCVVDATGWIDTLADPAIGRLARRQVEAAHIVLLSKVDLVSRTTADTVIASIAETAPGRRVVPVDNGAVEPAVVLGAAVLGASLPPPLEPHGTEIVTRTIELDQPLDMVRLAAWLERGSHGLLRAKGWFPVDDHEVYELQLVGRRWTIGQAAADLPRSVVLIGTEIEAVDAAVLAFGEFGAGRPPACAAD